MSIYYNASKETLIHAGNSNSLQVRGKLVSGAFRLLVDACLLDEPKWCTPLAEALAPKPGERILDCGPGSSLRTLHLAEEFPETQFVAIETNRGRLAKYSKQASLMSLSNYEVLTFENIRKMPFDAGLFDKVAIVLNLHSLDPEDKARNLVEIRRITRRGGIVLAADIGEPKASHEDVVLKITQMLYGSEAIRTHTTGTWPKFLSDAGFAGVRRLSEHPIWIGRIVLVRGRKQ